MPGDGQEGRPQRPLTLDPSDDGAVAQWPPVANTLGQFIDLYEQMGEMVVGRMETLAKSS
jgi:hypothetical protein